MASENPLKRFQNWLSNLADDMDAKHVKKMNAWDNGDDPGLRFLDIPVVGGFMYIASSYNRAMRLVRLTKIMQKEKQNVRNLTKERNQVKRNIVRQINDMLLEDSVGLITVPKEHMAEFLEVVKELDVGINQIESNKFMVVAKEGVVL